MGTPRQSKQGTGNGPVSDPNVPTSRAWSAGIDLRNEEMGPDFLLCSAWRLVWQLWLRRIPQGISL